MVRSTPIPELTDEQFEKIRYLVDDSNGPESCWEWRGRRNGGYGQINVNGREIKTHRIAFNIANGPILDREAVVAHKCDNPSCCNPDHLFLTTQAGNVADMIAKKRDRKARGEKQPNSKLTEQQVREIKSRPFKHGLFRQLEREFGVSNVAIACVYRGKTWAHVK